MALLSSSLLMLDTPDAPPHSFNLWLVSQDAIHSTDSSYLSCDVFLQNLRGFVLDMLYSCLPPDLLDGDDGADSQNARNYGNNAELYIMR